VSENEISIDVEAEFDIGLLILFVLTVSLVGLALILTLLSTEFTNPTLLYWPY